MSMTAISMISTSATRHARVAAIVEKVAALMHAADAEGLSTRLIAGGSYTFDLWPHTLADFVSAGSWTYLSAQHDLEFPSSAGRQAPMYWQR